MSRNPFVNILWVGIPTNKEDGHDECGIRSLVPRTSEETLFTFWCLKQYRGNFESRFSTLPVRIETIEDFFYAHHTNCYFKRAIKIFEQEILAEGRNQNRDRIDIKELMQLLLWYMRGGYGPEYNKKKLHLILKSELLLDDNYENPDLAGLQFWHSENLRVGYPVHVMEDPKVEKRYGNSHIAEDRVPIPSAHFAAANEDLLALAKQSDVNGFDETRVFCNITPLYVSLFYQKIKAALLLLSMGASTDLPLQLKTGAVLLFQDFLCCAVPKPMADAILLKSSVFKKEARPIPVEEVEKLLCLH